MGANWLITNFLLISILISDLSVNSFSSYPMLLYSKLAFFSVQKLFFRSKLSLTNNLWNRLWKTVAWTNPQSFISSQFIGQSLFPQKAWNFSYVTYKNSLTQIRLARIGAIINKKEIEDAFWIFSWDYISNDCLFLIENTNFIKKFACFWFIYFFPHF